MSKRKKQPKRPNQPVMSEATEARTAVPRGQYEAVRHTHRRKLYPAGQAPNLMVDAAAITLREQARHLARNHDLSRGILRTMVNNICGHGGIGIEPMPRKKDGKLHEEYAAALRKSWWDWNNLPEVTWKLTWPMAQRMLAAAMIRDGEAFAQMLCGPVTALDHGTRVPFSLELFEADMVPLDYNDEPRRVRQGIERNAWGRMTAAWVYKEHPGDSMSIIGGMKRIPANDLLHLYRPDRLHQLRGVSDFAAVINRLHDVKEYEEAEQIAARLAANLTLFIRRNNPDGFSPEADVREKDVDGNPVPRDIEISMGSIVDDLQVGEDIGMVDSKRPNPNAITWRQGQLRAVAAGIGASYSSISRDYDGTYSAQRQEMVEQWVNYAVLTDEFTGLLIKPVWERFVQVAHLSGVVSRPADVSPDTADDALFVGQSMPWIDPLKEASAWTQLVQSGFSSPIEVIRRMGKNPRDVLNQNEEWKSECEKRGLHFSTSIADPAPESDSADPRTRNRK